MLNGGEKGKSLTWRQSCFEAVKGEEGTLQGGVELCLAAPSVEPLKKKHTKTIKTSQFPNGELPTQTGLPPPQVLGERRAQQRGAAWRGLRHRLLPRPLERRHLQRCRGLDLRAQLLAGFKKKKKGEKPAKKRARDGKAALRGEGRLAAA